MRSHTLLFMAGLALGAAGCLDMFVPPHSTVSDGGAAAPAPTAPTGGNGGNGGTSGVDAGASSDGGTTTPPSGGNNSACITPAAPTIDGHHHVGEACLMCHDGNLAGANKFSFAGTVYDAASLGAPKSGIAIEVVDSKGVKVQVVSASSGMPGNFWSTDVLTPPLTIRASACPASMPMVSKDDTGNCNKCHNGTMTAVVHVP